MLGVHQVTVDHHIENATGAFNKKRIGVIRVFQFSRQTDGFWFIRSRAAISNGDVHSGNLRWPRSSRIITDARRLRALPLVTDKAPRLPNEFNTWNTLRGYASKPKKNMGRR